MSLDVSTAHDDSPDGVPGCRLGGVRLSLVDMEGAVERIAGWAGGEPLRTVVTPNVDHFIHLRRNESFRRAYERASLALADGAPVVWAARTVGLPPVRKVSGSDLLPRLCRRGAAEGWRVYFAGGATEADLEADLAEIGRRWPGLIVGGAWPPFGFEADPAATERLLASIGAFGPHLILMGCGSPKSEIWMDTHRDRLGRGVGLSIGAGMKFLSGRERRAPRWMQRAGLEWLWRLARDPRRLARRYLWDDLRFFPMVWGWRRERHKK